MSEPKTIFVDTSAFKALVDPRDEFHARAVKTWEMMAKAGVKLISTNYILDESYTLIRIRCGIKVAKEFRDLISASGEDIKIMRSTLSDEFDAWTWFEKDWSKLSFTDCGSFAQMKRLNLSVFFGFDEHFVKAGFHTIGI